MKKTFTKIAATLSAALLGALPMANSLTASAATTVTKTYRTYWYYSGGAQQTRRVDVEFFTNKPLYLQGSARTTGCLNGWMDFETGSGSQYGALHYKRWKTNNITSGVGIMFKTVTEVQTSSGLTYNDLIGRCDITAYDAYDHVIPNVSYSFSANTYLVGDINGNGVVNSTDRTLLNRIIKGQFAPTTGTEIYASDIDGDGDHDQTDLQFLDGYLNGWYTLTQIQA
ncbi:dockerin type I repeat-containing protein [Ruminococcus flavefaciens]|jgi:hypothetical protein|uniref:dockerin type I repeat-containing protein n=1 Tax=Ruminococcus flavefaciens TaxID=1265 RepID=UPI00049168C5|nr:dockerin type I repeat-containing protein [Ruminococcus flavefaciens]